MQFVQTINFNYIINMSESSPYDTLYAKVIAIAKSYYLAGFLVGFTPELLNLLFMNHIESLRDAHSYDDVMNLANKAMQAHMSGSSMRIESFITVESDRQELYRLYREWRALLLSQ